MGMRLELAVFGVVLCGRERLAWVDGLRGLWGLGMFGRSAESRFRAGSFLAFVAPLDMLNSVTYHSNSLGTEERGFPNVPRCTPTRGTTLYYTTFARTTDYPSPYALHTRLDPS